METSGNTGAIEGGRTRRRKESVTKKKVFERIKVDLNQ